MTTTKNKQKPPPPPDGDFKEEVGEFLEAAGVELVEVAERDSASDSEFRAECKRLESQCMQSGKLYLDAREHAKELKEQHAADVAELREYVRTEGGSLPLYQANDGEGNVPA